MVQIFSTANIAKFCSGLLDCKVIREIENKLKGFLQRILQEIMKKDNTSDAWSMRLSSHGPNDPVYFVEDCWISGVSPFCV